MENKQSENNHSDNQQETQPANAQTPEGEGEQSLYAGKYNSVDALEQGYKELSRLVREKSPEAPEEYSLDFSDQPELADIDVQEDPLWQHMTPAMREANLTQEQAENVTKAFIGWQQQQAETEKQNFEELGAEGQAMAQRITRFIDKNLPEDQAEVAHSLAGSVDGLRFLNTLADVTGEKAIPTQSQSTPESTRQLRQKAFEMLADPELSYNQEKQQAYNRLWQDIESLES